MSPEWPKATVTYSCPHCDWQVQVEFGVPQRIYDNAETRDVEVACPCSVHTGLPKPEPSIMEFER